jgi:flagellar motor protein MotB
MIIPLEEASGFAFEAGHADLPDVFKDKLNSDVIPRILSIVADYPNYPIEMEVIGHTDGNPKGGSSNLDSLLNGFTLDANAEGKIAKLESGSNADLGMARALSVSAFLHSRFVKSGNAKLEVMACRSYSGAQLIAPVKNLIEGAINEDVPSRRRIELRFTQKHAQP